MTKVTSVDSLPKTVVPPETVVEKADFCTKRDASEKSEKSATVVLEPFDDEEVNMVVLTATVLVAP